MSEMIGIGINLIDSMKKNTTVTTQCTQPKQINRKGEVCNPSTVI